MTQQITSMHPECYLSVRRNRVRQSGGLVYLENGTEFELEMFNKSQDIQKAEITINGKRQSRALVLKPGEHFYLDRFMDEQKKFKFDVYTVDDAPEVQAAIHANGTIKVQFFKQREQIQYPETHSITWYGDITYRPPFDGKFRSSQIAGNNNMYNEKLTSGMIQSNVLYASNSINCSNTSDAFSNTVSTTRGADSVTFVRPIVAPKMETGRVDAGNKSDQTFSLVNYDFESYATATYEFKILPISQMKEENIDTKDLRSYCTNCGRRLKRGWNNCAGCGTKL